MNDIATIRHLNSAKASAVRSDASKARATHSQPNKVGSAPKGFRRVTLAGGVSALKLA
jgi:hypothetical protein